MPRGVSRPTAKQVVNATFEVIYAGARSVLALSIGILLSEAEVVDAR
jgi:hypothetical protein